MTNHFKYLGALFVSPANMPPIFLEAKLLLVGIFFGQK
jgi:hypothetical protein